MRISMKTGLLLLLSITTAIGRVIEEERNRDSNITNIDEEPSENNCNCEWRYYKHYEAKGCQVMQVDSCGCPKKYLCPLSSDSNEEQKTCIYQDQEYKLGSKINVPDPCQFCRCLGENKPQIVCRTKNCPQLESMEKKNCHLVYERDQCCPLKYECVLSSQKNEAIEKGSFCVHDRITYPLGAKIYPKEDPCLICECTEEWRGVSNASCYNRDCLWEKNKHLFDAGCIPIYHENKCCPIEFHCPERPKSNVNTSAANYLSEENSEHPGKCSFGDDVYETGSELIMQNACIKCNCMVPPDFSCVHQSCPPAPSIEKCEVVYSTSECCPSYKCTHEDMDNFEIACPTPVCADITCEIKIPENHRCPTCVCEGSISHEKNILEPNDELIMEGPIANASETEDVESETENFDAEILSPSEMEFSDGNKNMSEKFTDDDSEKEHIEYDEIEKLDHEIENIFEEGRETIDNDEFSSNEREEFLSNEDFHISNATSEKTAFLNLRKRSSDYRNNNNELYQDQQQQQYNQQQQFFEEETDSNREISEDSDEGFDELKLSSMNRKSDEEQGETNIDNDDLSSSESVIVPAGCPTPLCANSSCRIEIPVGHQCPTCVCKRRENWQP